MGNIFLERVLDIFGFPTHKPPVLTGLKYTNFPQVGVPSLLTIKTKFASAAHCKITDADGKVSYDGDMPVNSTITVILVSIAPITITITLDPRLASADIIAPSVYSFTRFVKENPPWFWPRVPWLIRVGEEGMVSWRSRAKEVMSEIITGEGRQHEQGLHRHAFLHKFAGKGRAIIKFIAKDEHSVNVKIKSVLVRGPAPPRLWVENRILCGRVGENVAFMWKIKADDAWIVFGDKRQKVPLNGEFSVEISHSVQEFVLTGRTAGGLRRMRLKAMPWLGLESNHI